MKWLIYAGMFAFMAAAQIGLVVQHVRAGMRWQLDAAAFIVCAYACWNNVAAYVHARTKGEG